MFIKDYFFINTVYLAANIDMNVKKLDTKCNSLSINIHFKDNFENVLVIYYLTFEANILQLKTCKFCCIHLFLLIPSLGNSGTKRIHCPFGTCQNLLTFYPEKFNLTSTETSCQGHYSLVLNFALAGNLQCNLYGKQKPLSALFGMSQSHVTHT